MKQCKYCTPCKKMQLDSFKTIDMKNRIKDHDVWGEPLEGDLEAVTTVFDGILDIQIWDYERDAAIFSGYKKIKYCPMCGRKLR